MTERLEGSRETQREGCPDCGSDNKAERLDMTDEGNIFDYPCTHLWHTPAAPETPPAHPKDFCQECGGPNVVWFADNPLWNLVMPGRVGVLCPICFVKKAEKIIDCTGWRLVPENWEHLGTCGRDSKGHRGNEPHEQRLECFGWAGTPRKEEA